MEEAVSDQSETVEEAMGKRSESSNGGRSESSDGGSKERRPETHHQ